MSSELNNKKRVLDLNEYTPSEVMEALETYKHRCCIGCKASIEWSRWGKEDGAKRTREVIDLSTEKEEEECEACGFAPCLCKEPCDYCAHYPCTCEEQGENYCEVCESEECYCVNGPN